MLCQISCSCVGGFVFCTFGCPTLSTGGCVGIGVGVAHGDLSSLWGLGVTDCLHNLTFRGVCFVFPAAVGAFWRFVDTPVSAGAVKA